jgi:hypothetical protein
MTNAKIRSEIKRIDKEREKLFLKLNAYYFELGRREDKKSCESDNPDDKCSYCTCWKHTRELCS